jgi:hypothetical protein
LSNTVKIAFQPSHNSLEPRVNLLSGYMQRANGTSIFFRRGQCLEGVPKAKISFIGEELLVYKETWALESELPKFKSNSVAGDTA